MPVATQERAQASRKIPVINGLRGIAIIGVVLSHTIVPLLEPWRSAISLGSIVIFPMTLITNGYQGVTLFFLLSGFVLALPYMSGRRTLASHTDISSFYRRRAFRLLPLYVVCMGVSLCFYQPKQLLLDLFLYATLTFPFFEHSFYPLPNAVLWTLGVEIWLSCLLPIFLLVRSSVRVLTMTVCSVLLTIFIQYISVYTHWWLPIADGVPVRLSAFLLGILLAERHARGVRSGMRAMMAGIFLLVLSFFLSDLTYSIATLTKNLQEPAYRIFRPLIISLSGLGFFFLTDVLLHSGRTILVRIISCIPLQMLGLMCYSVYVWHYILIKPLAPAESIANLLTYLFVLGVISVFSYFCIEFGHVRDLRRLLPTRD